MTPTLPPSLRVLFTVLLLLPSVGAADRAPFQVGTGWRDITPTEPVPMWGYGARHAARSQGMFDPLYAKAVVIQAGDQKLAIVGLDLGRSPGEGTLQKIRDRIRKDAGIEHSIIGGSHTHHGPVLEFTDKPGRGKGKFDAALRYYAVLEDAIVGAILDANADLGPANMAVGTVDLDGFNRNRHSKIDRVVDRQLGVVRFDTPGGKPKAVLVNFAAHPTIVSAAGLRFSSDFVGPMRRVIERELPGARAVFMQGASGDLSADQNGKKGHEAYGTALGQEVAKFAKTLSPEPVPDPALKVTEEQLTFKSRIDAKDPATRVLYSVAFFPELVNNYFDDYAAGTVRPRLTVAVLNRRVALVGVSGEFFAAHAIRLRQRARVEHLLFFGYANGYHQYFPTIEAAAEGGYGADQTVAPAEVGAGERVMDTALIRIYQGKRELP